MDQFHPKNLWFHRRDPLAWRLDGGCDRLADSGHGSSCERQTDRRRQSLFFGRSGLGPQGEDPFNLDLSSRAIAFDMVLASLLPDAHQCVESRPKIDDSDRLHPWHER